MKFRLISRQGVDEGTGEISDPFAGQPTVLVWRGRTFATLLGEMDAEGRIEFREVLGQALDDIQVTTPAKAAVRWTSPTAIGRMAEKAPDVVDSVAPGYVYLDNPPRPTAQPEVEEEPFRWDIVDCSDPPGRPSFIQPRRRTGEPS